MPRPTPEERKAIDERRLRRERQLEGIAKVRAEGVYAGKGRPASIDATKVREMKSQGLDAAATTKALGIGRASVSTRP